VDVLPSGLVGLPVTQASIGGLELDVVVAATPGARSRGLMDVADLSPIDGMAFVFDAPTETGFYMQDVLVPLDIAFIGTDGRVIDVRTMQRCDTEPCPIYHASAPFQWAVETPAGGLAGIEAGDAFSLEPWAS
jgi:uncharacterized membrane protein (UPF0127 family)